MSLIKSAGRWGLVLDAPTRMPKKLSGSRSGPFIIDGPEIYGHFIFDRYTVDKAGYICLTPTLPLRELHGSVEIFKAELENLLEQARQHFSDTLAQ